MKSFKQKQEEKAIQVEAERLLAEEKEFKIQQQAESNRIEKERIDEIAYNKALLKEQQEQENAIWEEREARKAESQYDLKHQESTDRNKQINDYRKLKDIESEFKSAQKGTIKEILSGEDEIRETISSIERQTEMDDYELSQLQKIEAADKLLEQQLAVENLKREQEKLDKIAEEKKLTRWKEDEKVEEEENTRMKELRESQERDKKEQEAIQLQEIISSREIYELRQQEIAKEQQQERTNINNILQEAQYILDSQKQTHTKDVLSNLHDYIYRLNPDQERNIWTERVQPKAVLTWDDWKGVPANNILIEQDFKRARLLFEQDNQRATRYHMHMYQQFAARNLTLDRKKAIASAGKLVDISQDQLVKAREDLVNAIPDCTSWIDAAYTPSIQAIHTGSINTASISVAWVPDEILYRYDGDTVVTTFFEHPAWYNSASLVISGANALFDGDPNTYMSIKHTSGSSPGVYDYDWNTRQEPHLDHKWRGSIMVRFTIPSEYDTSVIERFELTATDRKFIPTKLTQWSKPAAALTSRYTWHNHVNVTSSYLGNYNGQIGYGGEHLDQRNGTQLLYNLSGTGGIHGITPEGSASLDPLTSPMYPRKKSFTAYGDSGSYGPPSNTPQGNFWFANEYVFVINIAATGSELRFNKFQAWEEFATIGKGTPVHKQGIRKWSDKRFESSNQPAWYRLIGNTTSRKDPLGTVKWHSGSTNDPEGIKMPYMRFSSQSITSLRCDKEFVDPTETGGFTHFVVARDLQGKAGGNRKIFEDMGRSFRQKYNLYYGGYYSSVGANLVDWEQYTEGATSFNTRHGMLVGASTLTMGTETPWGGIVGQLPSGSWPYAANRWPNEEDYNAGNTEWQHLGATMAGICNQETHMLISQLDNPTAHIPSSSMYRFWFKGGTPFVDVDAEFGASYNMTGSGISFYPPTVGAGITGGEWGSYELHEMIYYKRVLSLEEMETVSSYLTDKWKLNNFELKDDRNGDFVYTVSSSVVGSRNWVINTSRDNNYNVYSSSLFQRT